MIPSDLADVRRRLDAAIRKRRVTKLRAEIERAAEPQIVLAGEGSRTSGDIHAAARKIDPTIPADFDKAFKRPGIEKMIKLVDEHEATAPGSGGEVGASRVGGRPDLPRHMEWPGVKGKHLPFIAQVDLAALPAWGGSPLPRAGWLWAFAGGDFPMRSAVLHWAGDCAALERRPTPPAGSFDVGEFVHKAAHRPVPVLGTAVVATVPGYGGEWWDEHVSSDEDLEDAMMDLVEDLLPEESPAATLLGLLASEEESPTELARQYGKRKGDDWVKLMEVESVGSMCWSDSGTLAFLIRASALARGDFSDTYAVVCSS